MAAKIFLRRSHCLSCCSHQVRRKYSYSPKSVLWSSPCGPSLCRPLRPPCLNQLRGNMSSSILSPRTPLVMSKEVDHALQQKHPVVALESTIITHGMPYPENLRATQIVMDTVRENGAIPAVIALIRGKVHIGLSADELELLSQVKEETIKTSRRDLAWVLSQGLLGGTTVSGTMVIAHKAGIPVFVTGGIGGVHRGAQTSFDISADLTELGRTPVAVVCAGVKSILDIRLTLEYLETQGVTVASFGESKEFPAFFSRESGFEAPYNVTAPVEAAKMIDFNHTLDLRSGMVIAVPIPEEFAIPKNIIDQALVVALQEASSQGVTGKDITPFLLKRVNDITGGQSLQANVALIKNNARVGSQIAVELAKILEHKKKSSVQPLGTSKSVQSTGVASTLSEDNSFKPVVIGGSNVDIIAKPQGTFVPQASNPGIVRQTYGGVARNVAECLARLEMKPLLISAVGGDPRGVMMLKNCDESKISIRGIHIYKEKQTATYCATITHEGELLVAVEDMSIHQEISPLYISGFEEFISNAPLVCVDGNISEETIKHVCGMCAQHNVPVWFEPTNLIKADKPFHSDAWHNITFASPNIYELRIMYNSITNKSMNSDDVTDDLGEWEHDPYLTLTLDDIIKECITMSEPLLQHLHCIVVTLGRYGVLVCRNTPADTPFVTSKHLKSGNYAKHQGLVSAVHYPAVAPEYGPVDIVNVTGAGDSLVGAMMYSMIKGLSPDTCIKAGLLAATYSLSSEQAISHALNPKHFTHEKIGKWKSWQSRNIDL